MRKFFRRNTAGYVFLTPWLVGFFFLALGPILVSLYLSFTRYDMVSAPVWDGLGNYRYMFEYDRRFWKALEVTFTFVAFSVPLRLAAALGVAMLLDKGLRTIGVYRAIFYLPSLLGASIAIALLWREMFGLNGVINQVLAMVGITGKGWITDPDTSIYTIVVLAMWQFGSPMLIFLAGLRGIPRDLYEAAEIDGTSRFRQFRRITLPMLAPVIFFNLVLQTIEAFKTFTSAFIISNGTGAPADSLLFYTVYLFNEAFKFFRMGYASALAWVLLLIIAAFTALAFATSKYWVHYENERD
ncbi:carbohydrate ABC transporter membrane protein 1, CUT1 family [Pseudooceanicola antarcticus]|uniref:Carbohydrate ABC transporter membrane protein 1, CUT1 family n=1 Tax=Pseudooceanicola antarcticus TaxID=1247613 RepID=A0A285IKX7_9RHOB|nr:sugar ABC transporter permease [Pseudooceanicola antarcticus]PJE28663.1 sugar ABC transporter permease [Pseudooceanicola antarcticus]SNY48618.1 carbohydrate ABC transporter membrane protein 1, CUT1 family [Pseudooceanicola antarcticus]